ncbi:MAG: CHASE2 domain-containing protein [Deltaproteobacteria bacterium]|nr:CHASE2 domain-containing protein [Deltaproteobacteria bacterium]
MKASSHRDIGAAAKNFLTHPAFLGILLTFMVSLTGFFKPTFIEFLDYKAFDALSAPGPDADISSIPVIIDIDEKSLKLHGQWPWPRYKMALLLNRLHAMGVRAVGIDIMFPEKDRTVIDPSSEDIPEDLKADIGIADVRGSAGYSDRLFAEAVSRSSAVLGFQFRFESSPVDAACVLHPVAMDVMQSGGGEQLHGGLIEAAGIVYNLPELTRATHSAGFFNVSPDSDGILRSVPLLMKYKGELYPSLALAVLMKAFNTNKLLLQYGSNGGSLHLANRNIPLTSGGRLWVNFRGKGGTFAYISAADILSGKTPPDALMDKIVFLGTSAEGLKEFRSISTDPIYPGVEVHATVVDNYIRSDFLVRPFYASGFEVLLALITGMAFTVIFSRSSALLTLLSVCGGTIGLWALSVLAFKTGGVLLSPVLPILALLSDFSLLNLVKFWREESKSKQRTRELALAQEAIIESMASLTETRDPETGGHIKRTQNYVRLLARTLRESSPKHRALLDDETIDLLFKSAPLHDIGKVGVPDGILLKPGKLSETEFEEMKKHAVIGRNAIRATERRLGNGSFLRFAHDIAYTHHEKWNGSGYPQGLRGEEIPLCGRLMALADTYDALINQRVYKPSLTHEEAIRIIVKDKGTHFDPEIVDAFLTVSEEFRNIARKYADSEKQDTLKLDDQAIS